MRSLCRRPSHSPNRVRYLPPALRYHTCLLHLALQCHLLQELRYLHPLNPRAIHLRAQLCPQLREAPCRLLLGVPSLRPPAHRCLRHLVLRFRRRPEQQCHQLQARQYRRHPMTIESL